MRSATAWSAAAPPMASDVCAREAATAVSAERSGSGSVALSTTSRGWSVSTARSISAIGVSAPRNTTRQPDDRREIPNTISGRSWSSPGGHASNAIGPAPCPSPARGPSAGHGARCSRSAPGRTVMSPESHRSPIPCSVGSTTSARTVSEPNLASAVSRISCASVASYASSACPRSAASSSRLIPRARSDVGLRERPLSGLGSREPGGEELVHPPNARLVIGRVEPKAAGRA